MLFTINLTSIVLVSSATFLLDGYGRFHRASPGMLAAGILLALVSPALAKSMQQMRADDEIQLVVEDYLKECFA